MRTIRYFYTSVGPANNIAYFFDLRIDPQTLPAGATQVAVSYDQQLEVDEQAIPWMGSAPGRKAVGYWQGAILAATVPANTQVSIVGCFWAVAGAPALPPLG